MAADRDPSIGHRRTDWGSSSQWVIGLVLVLIGVLFLLQNLGVIPRVGNWWAFFILIPSVAAFAAAWAQYQRAGRVAAAVMAVAFGGLVPLVVALIFLLNLPWSVVWPVFVILASIALIVGRKHDQSSS